MGFLYYGGLWLTVNKLTDARRPTLLLLGSFLVRLIIVLVILFFFIGGHWVRIIAWLAGFIAMRFIFVRYYRPQKSNAAKQEDA